MLSWTPPYYDRSNSKSTDRDPRLLPHAALRVGRQHWWPAQARFEVIVGAYLTQNTSWTNVEKALGNLRKARLLTIRGIRRTPQSQLEQLIRPSGYFRQKRSG